MGAILPISRVGGTTAIRSNELAVATVTQQQVAMWGEKALGIPPMCIGCLGAPQVVSIREVPL